MRVMRMGFVAVVVVVLLSGFVVAGGYVQIDAQPGVQVFIDGEAAGVTEEAIEGLLIADVAPGERRLRFVLEGFEPREVTVVVVEGRVLVHDVERFEPQLRIGESGERSATELRKLTGTLIVQSLPVGAVIDVRSLALVRQPKTRDVWTLEQVPVGVHEVTVSALGRTVSATVDVVDGEVTRVFAFLGVDPPRIEVVQVEGDAISIERLEPSPIRSREARQVVQVLGRGFVPGSTVTFFWEGRSFPIPAERTTFVSPVRIDVTAALFPAATSWSVVVENPGGARSVRLPFGVVD